MCLRNLETVRSYVNEALFFSRSAKLHGQPGLLDEMVREAVSLVQPNAEAKNIRLSFTGAVRTRSWRWMRCSSSA